MGYILAVPHFLSRIMVRLSELLKFQCSDYNPCPIIFQRPPKVVPGARAPLPPGTPTPLNMHILFVTSVLLFFRKMQESR